MQNERSQVTVFLILCLFIAITGGILYISAQDDRENQEIQESNKAASEIVPIRNFIDNCIKIIGENGIYNISQQGGYYRLPKDNVQDAGYFYYLGEIVAPTIETIQDEMSEYMIENLQFCLDDLVYLETQGFNIKIGNLNVETLIREEDVLFKANLSMIILKNGLEHQLEEFNVIIPSRLKKFFELSLAYVQFQDEEPNLILVSRMIEIGKENNVTFSLEEDYFGDVVFNIIDQEPILDGTDFNLSNEYSFR